MKALNTMAIKDYYKQEMIKFTLKSQAQEQLRFAGVIKRFSLFSAK
jgi:hypothetical protein